MEERPPEPEMAISRKELLEMALDLDDTVHDHFLSGGGHVGIHVEGSVEGLAVESDRRKTLYVVRYWEESRITLGEKRRSYVFAESRQDAKDHVEETAEGFQSFRGGGRDHTFEPVEPVKFEVAE